LKKEENLKTPEFEVERYWNGRYRNCVLRHGMDFFS